MRFQLAVLAVAVAVAAAATALASISSADAHARLKESTPAVGEVLAASPASVSITFTNDIQKISGTEVQSTPSSDSTRIVPVDNVGSDDNGNDNLVTFVFIGAGVAVAAIVGSALWRATSARRTE